ncbi:fused MFS/spermidine synthase [Myroides sp. 1354]|uniref:spermidine synthase n=1 Tax=unclassified Myroides TaxID=2642485 RepID=UPI002578205B|nr:MULTISPECIES: fused MFS/spermidine synthase [unclassified Myroides]MDM1044898.1 fused MFS/spermidine synthase [Myroides sp. R163-1]MDM1055611.1 fused MFS/spermidine synthase [Myroides sp. 1354]MDM1068908.1 fused MFS/spermidine synthase [Myroides sp. 1372]
MLKKWLSYLTPIPVKKISSKINNKLEITWQKGQLVLDTKNTNYSYGQLEQVFKRGLKFIGYQKIKAMNQVLNLGLGAGSTVHLLRNEVNYTGSITSVELDEAIIYVAQKYFNLDRYKDKHNIVQLDAFEYVLTCQEQYDLIVIDIFQDTYMPSFLFEQYFVYHLKQILAVNGFIIFNTIVLSLEDEQRNQVFKALFDPTQFSVRFMPTTLEHNSIITIKRLA